MSTRRILGTGLAIGLVATLLVHRDGMPAPIHAQNKGGWVGVSLPSRVAAVGAEQAGAIVEMPKSEGQSVAEGDVLFLLSSGIQSLEVERLEALVKSKLAVDKARLKAEYRKRVADRFKGLANQEISSGKDFEERQFDSAMAKAEYDLAVFEHSQQTLKLKQARLRLEQRTIRSPVSGRVTAWHKQPGEPVDKFEPVIELARFDPLWIEFDCPILDQRFFRLEELVTVAPASDPENGRPATVVFTSMKARPSSHAFRVRLSTPNPKHDWKSGQKMLITRVQHHATPPSKGK